MLYKIQYVFDRDANRKEVLEGAKVFQFDGKDTTVKEIYVGIQLDFDSIYYNQENAQLIGVRNREVFKAQYEKYEAAGVIYFPQTGEYEFLEEGDIVLPWVSNELIEDTLESALQIYRNEATDNILKQKLDLQLSYVETLEPDDPLIELNDLYRSRTQSSR